MRTIFIGCVDFSHALLEKAMTAPAIELAGVVTRESSNFNADFRSLAPLAATAKIPCFVDRGNRQAEFAPWIASLAPDIIFCFGWPYLLQQEILMIPKLGVVGYHPTALPENRGRHPVIWTLALGLRETGSSFFFMNERADSGDLLSQRRLEVGRGDDAAALYSRLKGVAIGQMEELITLLASGKAQRMPQDHARANYWRRRGKADGRIDWRMPAEGIYNLVRALTRPYPGAHCEYEGAEIRVWHCEVSSNAWTRKQVMNLEPGRVLDAGPDGVEVRCGDGVIRLIEHEFKVNPVVGACL